MRNPTELRHVLEDLLDRVNVEYPVTAGGLYSQLQGEEGSAEVVAVLNKLRHGYVIDSRQHAVDILEDPAALHREFDVDKAGETADYNNIKAE